MLIVQALAGILLKMQPLDCDRDGLAARHVDDDFALADDRILILRDLIAGRKIRIEVVLAIEHRGQVDLGLEPKARAHRLLDAIAVDHRQHPRHRRIDERDMRVGLGAELGRSAGEQLRLGEHLRVHFHADDDFPLARDAVEERAQIRSRGDKSA